MEAELSSDHKDRSSDGEAETDEEALKKELEGMIDSDSNLSEGLEYL